MIKCDKLDYSCFLSYNDNNNNNNNNNNKVEAHLQVSIFFPAQ